MKLIVILIVLSVSLTPFSVSAKSKREQDHHFVSDQVIIDQRNKLAENTQGRGYGPQSPRDINSSNGSNARKFGVAPVYSKMNLCNIHFHKNAEHRGGEFIKYAGNGNGEGYQSGYQFAGHLSASDLKPIHDEVCLSKHGGLESGDTIEVHYVHSSAAVKPGPSLGACLSDAIKNPHLRVEAQVFVLVNDSKALDFVKLSRHNKRNGVYQALNIPDNTGQGIQYAGSTTGPSYNETGSPLQVTWNVRPKVAKVNIQTVGEWCKGNVFKEDHAHGVRNLIVNPALLSEIVD